MDVPTRLVYRVALRELSWHEPRPLKMRWLARQVRNRNGAPMNLGTVSRSLDGLLRLGYLERGPDDGRLHTYILRTELPQIDAA